MDFASSRLKVARSGEHLQALNVEIDAFMARHPYALDTDLEASPDGSHGVRPRVKEEPPDHLSLVAADAIQNLRAALDHAVYDLSATKADTTMFPITDTPARFAKRRASYLAGVPNWAVMIIETFQPYHSGSKAHNDPLSLLQGFNNRDEHRVTQVGFARPQGARIQQVRVGHRPVLDVPTTPPGPIPDGTTLFRFHIEPPPPLDEPFPVRGEIDLTIGFGSMAVSPFDIIDMGKRVEELLTALDAAAP